MARIEQPVAARIAHVRFAAATEAEALQSRMGSARLLSFVDLIFVAVLSGIELLRVATLAEQDLDFLLRFL